MKKIKQIGIFPQSKSSFKLVKDQVDALAVDSIAKTGLRISLVVVGISGIVLALAWRRLPPEVPLLYSRPYGQDQLMSVWGLWMLLGWVVVINAISVRIAGTILEREKLMAEILVWTASLIAMMAGAGLIRIILLVI